MNYRMPMQTRDYVDVIARSLELGCRVPVGIALLPGNFEAAASAAEFRYHEVAPRVRSAWRSIGLIDAGPNRTLGQQPAAIADVSGRPVPLAVFFGKELSTGPAGLVTLALGTVASVLTLGPSRTSASDILFDAIVERQGSGSYACLEYRGDAYELVGLGSAVRGILAGNPLLDVESLDAQVA